MTRKQTAGLLAVFFFCLSFLPLSHCHAVEESQPRGLPTTTACPHDHGNGDGHEHSPQPSPDRAGNHTLPHLPVGSCCSPLHSDHSHHHHHFLSECLHYSSDRKRLFQTWAVSLAIIPVMASRHQPRVVDPLGAFFLRPPMTHGGSDPTDKRSSGISPPGLDTGS